MVDTIHFYLSKGLFKSSSHFKAVKEKLMRRIIEDGGESEWNSNYWTVIWYKYFQFTFEPWRISIKGNLWKYYKGTNTGDFFIYEVKYAIRQLSRDLGICVENGIVTRLDVAQNFSVSDIVGRYIREMEKPRKMGIFEDYDGETIGYKNKSNTQQILFYDKANQVAQLEEIFEDDELPENLLRYEYRLFKNPRLTLNLDNRYFKVAHLYCLSHLKRILDLWYANFFRVRWKTSPCYDNITGARYFKRYIMAEAINNSGGICFFTSLVESFFNKKGKPWSTSAKSKAKDFLEGIINDQIISRHSNLQGELKEMLKRRYYELREQLYIIDCLPEIIPSIRFVD